MSNPTPNRPVKISWLNYHELEVLAKENDVTVSLLADLSVRAFLLSKPDIPTLKTSIQEAYASAVNKFLLEKKRE